MSNQYEAANLLLKTACPNNEILVDEKGNPSVMVKIPKMTFRQAGISDSDAVLPAFIVNGKEVEAIYVSKYSNIVGDDGCAQSLPGVDPKGKIKYYDAVAACEAKGKGWHLMTKAEFALIAQICAQNGFLPWGNNLDGKDYREELCRAVPAKDGHTETGSGPLTWYHDKTYAGIADLNGNTSCWMGGIRLFYGELQILPDNDAADTSHSLAPDSADWRAIDGTTGELIVPDGNGTTPNSLKLDFNDRFAKKTCTCGWRWTAGEAANKVDKKRGDIFADTHTDETVCDKAKELLKGVGLLPVSSNPNTYEQCKFWANNGGGDLRVHCGGSYHDYYDSGVFFVRMCDDPDHGTMGIGFRACYVEL